MGDLSKRYGNLKAGSDDVLQHKWFSTLDQKKMVAKEITPPYKPNVKDDKDMSNYENIPDSTELPPAVPASADPFVDWQIRTFRRSCGGNAPLAPWGQSKRPCRAGLAKVGVVL